MKPVEASRQSEAHGCDLICGSDFSRDLDQAPFRFAQSWLKATPTSRTPPLLLALLSIIAFLIVPLPLHAQIEWTPEAQISLDDVYDDRLPQIAAGPDGRVWVVWKGFDGYDWEVFSSVWEGEAWRHPEQVSGDDFMTDGAPDVAVGPEGDAWTVWAKVVEGSPRLYYTRWNGDGWDPEQRVFPKLLDEPAAGQPVVAVDSDGTPWMVWSWPVGEGNDTDIHYSRWTGGSWSEAQLIVEDSGPGDVGRNDLAAGDNGDLWVMWVRYLDYPSLPAYSLYTHWQGAGWAPADTFPWAVLAQTIDIGVTSEVWVAWSTGGDVFSSNYSEGEWMQPERISTPDSTDYGINAADGWPRLSIAPDGTPWVVWVGRTWQLFGGSFDEEIYASHRIGGEWAAEQQVSTTDGLRDEYPDLVVAPDGRAWATWIGWDGRNYEILYSHSVGSGAVDSWVPDPTHRSILWLPSPVRSGGHARLRLPETVSGPILIHDLLGRIVARLEMDNSRALRGSNGTTTRGWDCRDASGRLVSPGTYVSTVTAGGVSYEKRIVVIR